MKRIVLGKSGIEAARLGFGGIPIQRVSEDQAIDTVLYAIDRGMDFVDTSRMYTNSERRIGKALKQTDKKVAVATKSFARSADGIRRDIEISLKELQLEYIDLYQCHSISSEEEYRKITSSGGAISGLLKARDEGLIGHIGITGHSLDLLEKAIDNPVIETIMVCFSLLEPAAAEKVIPKARERNVGVLAMKPFSGGVIEAAEAALKWVLATPDILVLAGVEERRLIDQNWHVFEGSYTTSDEEQQTIERIRKEFDRKFCRRCDYCLPCPVDIPIQYVMGVRSFVKRMGPAVLQSQPFSGMIRKAAECTECGECMARCPYDLPIPQIIKDNLSWVKSAGLG
ncbi:MAG: aldo/keto reductase [Acidobacteria bacterium]|nr:aldo/keto reductase [Acidobacteriota bacterium]